MTVLNSVAPVPSRERGGFFRYHGFWAPGVRTFRAVSFRAKALLISSAFAIPIVVLGVQYFADKQGAIAFSTQERLGVAYQRDLLPVLDALLRVRSAAWQSDEAAQASRAQLERATTALEQAQQRLGTTLNNQAAFDALVSRLRDLPSGVGVSRKTLEANDAAIKAALTLIGTVNDHSNLTLDPDIDTYYLMSAALGAGPDLQNALGRLQAASLIDLQGKLDMSKDLANDLVRRELADDTLAASLAHVASVHERSVREIGYDAARSAHLQFSERLLKAPSAQDVVESGDAALAAQVASRTRIVELLDQLLSQRIEGMERARSLTAVASLLSVLAAAYLFVSFRKVLDGGLREVASHIEAMRIGDLTTSPRPWGKDEVALLMRSLQEMQGALREIVTEVRGASDGIVSAAGQISAGSLDLSSRTEQSAANLQQSAAAMEQISATAQNTAAATRQAAVIASANASVAAEGGRVVGEMVHTMNGIGEASAKIGEITGTIDSLAFQTNILALNAAVEAARAGELGRGFAVVASEVRALAKRSSEAARQIKTLIGASVEQTQRGTQVVRAAGATMSQLMANASDVNALLATVSNGIEEQAKGVTETTASVQDLDRATQQNAALVEESAAAAMSLDSQARVLAGRVSRFVLPAA